MSKMLENELELENEALNMKLQSILGENYNLKNEILEIKVNLFLSNFSSFWCDFLFISYTIKILKFQF